MPVLEAPACGKRVAPTTLALTVENSLYLAVCCLALAVRLVAISGSQLTPAEATQALPAYRLALGSVAASTAGDSASPGLLSLQALAFALFTDNDAWARLPVVLLTALYPLAFWLLRPLVGRANALAAAALLLISPVWVTEGTLGLGGELSIVACLFSVGFAVQAAACDDDRWLLASGAALGLALAASTEGWAAATVAAALAAGEVWIRRQRLPFTGRGWRRFGIGVGSSILVFGTAAGSNPMGLQRVLDQGGEWLVSLVQPQPWALAIQSLLLLGYEPLLLVLTLVTVALVPPTTTWRRLLYLWTGVTLLLTLASGRQGGGILVLLPALALLAAQSLLAAVSRARRLERTVLLQGAGATGVLAVYGYVALTGFAVQGQLAYLVLAATALGIGGALLGLVSVRQGGATALALLSLAVVLVLGAYQVGAAWHGAVQRRGLAQELTYGQVGNGNLADLVADLGNASWARFGDPKELPITIDDGVGPLIRWYGRSLRQAAWVAGVPADAGTLAVLTSAPQLETLASQYVGQDYRVSDSWVPYFSDYRSLLRWLLFRQAEGIEHTSVTLWVLNDTAAAQ